MKKIISLLLSIIMVCTCLTVFVSADSSAKASVDGSFNGSAYYYRDSYFAEDASVYNPSLSTMSFVLTQSAFASSTGDYWSCQYYDLYKMFDELGFTDCDVNYDYTQYPGIDTMGVGMAHKTMTIGGKKYTMIAIVPRSANYEAEWANNFTLGDSGEATGFSNSAAKLETFANEYVQKYSSKFEGEIKLWIVGYSRGAAVANLVAGHLTKAGKIGNLSVAKENIYAYTFETPRGASTDVLSEAEAKTYTNIHNIITANDLVTKVAPACWGFICYGVNEYVIPETRTAENSALFDFALQYLYGNFVSYTDDGKKVFASETFQAKKLTTDITSLAKLGTWVKENGIYTWKPVDSATAKDILLVDSDKPMSEVLDDFISALGMAVGTRKDYKAQAEDLIRVLMSELLGSNYQTKILTTAKNVLSEELQAKKTEIIAAAASGNVSVLESVLNEIFTTVIEKSGLDVKAYASLPGEIAAVAAIFAKAAVIDIATHGGTDVISLIENIDIIFYPHDAVQVYAWLRALDPNYNPSVNVTSSAVTDVKVVVTKRTETKKVLFVKTTTTKYDVTIVPVSEAEVKNVEYRTLLVGKLTSGRAFTRDLNLSYLYISVTDANGNVTHWEYKNGSTKQVA